MPSTQPSRTVSAAPRLRFEHKYLVPRRLEGALRRVVEPLTRPDQHAGADHRYTVRSIYFDSADYASYYEKEDGVDARSKLRVRGYDALVPGAVAFLEIKRRLGNVGAKERVPFGAEGIAPLLAGGDVDEWIEPTAEFPAARRDARRFLFRLHRDALRPVVLITYEREAYVGTLEPSLRVTFDSGVRSRAFPELGELYSDDGLRPSLVDSFVLEVKYDAALGFPIWLRAFIAEHRLVRQALSKYWTCMTDLRTPRAASKARALVTASWPPCPTC